MPRPSETNIEYEQGELGRLEDIRLWWMLHHFSPDWPVTATWENFMIFLIDTYNESNKYPLDSEIIMGMFTRIRKIKNNPTRVELVHFLRKMRLTNGKIARTIPIGMSYIKKHLSNLEPMEYQVDLHPDMTKFNDFLANGFREVWFQMSNPKGWNSDMKIVWEGNEEDGWKFVGWESTLEKKEE